MKIFSKKRIEAKLTIKAPELLVFAFVLFFILELYTKIGMVNKISSFDVKYIKALVFLGFLVIMVFPKDVKVLIYLIGLLWVFVISQMSIEPSFSVDIINVFSKFLFPLLIFGFANYLIKPGTKINIIFITIEWLMVINSLLIFIGILFSIKLFNTYQGNRFGYNGLFNAVSTGSYAYIITLIYFLLSYKEKVIKNWKFILIFISCVFIGTKAVYLTMAFAIAYIVIVSKIPFKKTILVVATLTGLLLAYYFFFHYGIFNSIRQTDGLLSSLLSYRDQLFLERTLPFIQESWGWVNYLFGGVSDFDLRSQMDIIDVFFFWGLVGGAFYLYVFLKLFIPFKMNSTGWVFISFLAFIVLLAGNFFVYSFVALFLVVLKLKLQEKCNLSNLPNKLN